MGRRNGSRRVLDINFCYLFAKYMYKGDVHKLQVAMNNEEEEEGEGEEGSLIEPFSLPLWLSLGF